MNKTKEKAKFKPPEGTPLKVPLKDLRENDYNPRKRFNDAPMMALTDSISRVGLIQPLAVRKLDGKYEVIVGIRRLKALHDLYDGAYMVPCNLFNLNKKQSQIMSVTENTARQNMTPIEEARAYANYFNYEVNEKIKDLLFGKPFRLPKVGTVEELDEYSNMVGPTPVTIKNRIRLLFLIEHVQNMLENEAITISTAELLVNLMEIQNEDERAIRMKSLAEKYTGDRKSRSDQLEHELDTLLKNYRKSSIELQNTIREHEKELKHRKKALQEAIDGFKTEIGEDVAAEFLETIEFSENPKILEEAQALLGFWKDERATLIRDAEFKELSKRQKELHEERDRMLINAGVLGKHPGIDKCPFCGAGIKLPDLEKQIEELSVEIKGIEEEKEELNELQTAVDKAAKSLQSKASAYKTQYDAYETLKSKLEGENDGSE